MGATADGLVRPVANPALHAELLARLQGCSAMTGSLGELESLAIRLGLIQSTAAPTFAPPPVLVFAADHGLAVDNLCPGAPTTGEMVAAILDDAVPLSRLAASNGLELVVVDSGVAEFLLPRPRLLARKIGHGTRNARAGPAMSMEQAHAALRAGMEIADALPGDAMACCGMGLGSAYSAALVLACATDFDVREFLWAADQGSTELHAHLLRALDGVRERHGHLDDEIEILAAVGGFETAMMAGAMLAAASRRRLILADGLAACAALLVASSIAPAVGDYVVHTRSNGSAALDRALDLLDARAMVEPGLDSIDGTGAALAWPRIQSAAGLLRQPFHGGAAGVSHGIDARVPLAQHQV